MRYALAALLLGALTVLSGAPARAQFESRDAIALNNQIAELRRDVQQLRDQVARGGGGGGSTSALGGYRGGGSAPANAAPGSDFATQLLDRVSRLEDQLRELRGRIDEADNARIRLGEDLSKQIADLNFKLGAGGPGAPGLAAPGPAPAASVAPPAATGRRPPELALQQGNAALARRDYASAEVAAKEVLAGPRTPRTADAAFLLAQALAGKRDWAGSAVAYNDTYQAARTGIHASDALLGLATALTTLNDKRSACQALDKLRVEFPAPRQDLRPAIAAARLRAGCR